MNLLGAALYDPAGAVSKATSSLLAMTALDTTNLRLTVTVPAHGFIRVRMSCMLEGATTFPQILLGVLVGATVKGRVAPQVTINGTAVATTFAVASAEFTITGLTPGSTVFDAAYGVETVIASTNIKYGGPDNTTTNDAFGAFCFEIWDPQPIPTAAAGASGGLLISGTNTGTVTITDGLVINRSSSNSDALAIAGNGSGVGLRITGGATGIAMRLIGGATSGDGLNIQTTSGHGIAINPSGTNKNGITVLGAAGSVGNAGGAALYLVGGAGGTAGAPGAGIIAIGGAAGSSSGNAADAITLTGGAASAGPGNAGNGISATGGASSTTGAAAVGIRVIGGAGSASANGAAGGMTITGGGTNTVASNADGLSITGTSTGNGITAASGTGATGDGIKASAASTNGSGIEAIGTGTGNGMLLTGGTTYNLDLSANQVIGGKAVTGTLTTTSCTTSGLPSTSDSSYVGRSLVWTSGVNEGAPSTISAYNHTTTLLTFSAIPTGVAPSNGDTFEIV